MAIRSSLDSGSRLVVWGEVHAIFSILPLLAVFYEPVVDPVLGLRWVILDASLGDRWRSFALLTRYATLNFSDSLNFLPV